MCFHFVKKAICFDQIFQFQRNREKWLKLTVSQKGTKWLPSIGSPSERYTDVDFQIQYVVGKKQVRRRRRKQIIIFALQTFLACRTARQVETKLTQLELILNSKKQRTAGASIMKQSAALFCGKKVGKKWGNVNSINHYTWFCPGYILFCGFLKDKSSDDNHFSTTGALNQREKKTLHRSRLPLLAHASTNTVKILLNLDMIIFTAFLRQRSFDWQYVYSSSE